ncbi:hypothetical protein J7M22_17240, partial [Candidatus Poribacteria bacterium]|nr:hypothetical protein [Candidatus Poribacteria bacterium]
TLGVQQGGEALSSLGIYSMPGIPLAIKGRLNSSSLTNILYEEDIRILLSKFNPTTDYEREIYRRLIEEITPEKRGIIRLIRPDDRRRAAECGTSPSDRHHQS